VSAAALIWDALTVAGGTLALTLIVAIAVGINALALLFAGSAVVALERFARGRSPRTLAVARSGGGALRARSSLAPRPQSRPRASPPAPARAQLSRWSAFGIARRRVLHSAAAPPSEAHHLLGLGTGLDRRRAAPDLTPRRRRP
jgi:hypothetical protein